MIGTFPEIRDKWKDVTCKRCLKKKPHAFATQLQWRMQRMNILEFNEVINIATNALGHIASSTEDVKPPFRIMPAGRMREIAADALAEITEKLKK